MRSIRVRFMAVLAATVMAVSVTPLGESPAAAVVPTVAPTGLSPSGGFVPGNPQLSWGSVPDATRYRVQVSQSPSFTTTLVNSITYNTTFTELTELPVGTLYWRVQGMDQTSASTAPWSSVVEFEKGLAAPTPLIPGNNADVDYATTATTFAWTTTAGASSYVLEIDDATDFVGAKRVVVRTNGHTPLEPLAPGMTYYWRVRGSSNTGGTGILTNWSTTRSFNQKWTALANQTTPAPGSTVTDVELRWDPIPGAVHYHVQVATSQEFNDPMALKVTNGHSTRISYRESLDNASYWWRVQGVDSRGNLGGWSSPKLFHRNWIAAPTPVLPAADATTTGPLRFEWTAVDHAARYVLEVGENQFMASSRTCITRQTAVYATDCSFTNSLLGIGETGTDAEFWWRVRAIDDPAAIDGIWSTPRRHAAHTPEGILPGAFNPATTVNRLLPATLGGTCLTDPNANERADCTYNATPTFTWQGVPGANRYVLRIALDPNFTTVVNTYELGAQTAYQPLTELRDTDAGEAYYWHVQPCFGSSNCGLSPQGQSPPLPSSVFKKVSARVQLLSPSQGATVSGAPRFEWKDYLATTSTDVPDPAPGTTDVAAREYQIQVATNPEFNSPIDTQTVDQTFYTPWSLTYPEGQLYWRVRARDGSNNWLAWSYGTSDVDPKLPAEFVKSTPPPTPQLPTGNVSGPTLMRWSRVDGAGTYDLEIYRNGDVGFSTANRAYTARVETFEHVVSPILAPGDYTWRVKANDADNRSGAWSNQPNEPSIPKFTVQAAVPSLVAPANNATAAGNDILFSWNPVQGAAAYQWQRANDQAFVTGVSTVKTVMTSYAYPTVLANGNYWWRVVALDAAGNRLGTSAVRRLVKDIMPGAPTGVSAVRGDTAATVSWTAPANTGGTARTGYQVFPYINGVQQSPRTAPANATSMLVTGLTNGTTYTFRVAATNTGGNGPLSAASNAVTPAPGPTLPAGSVYVPVNPCRIVDTRNGGGAFGANVQRTYQVAGTGSAFNLQGGNTAGCGIPQGASAAEISVTAVNPAGNGFFRAWPAGQGAPSATFLNYVRGENVTNTGAVKIATGTTAHMTVRNYSAASHYVIDVQGFYTDGSVGPVAGGSVYVPITPCRIVDTRAGGGALQANVNRNFRVTGSSGFANQGGKASGCGIPAGASAIEGSVSAVSPAGNGFFRAWPTGQSMPAATFLNYTRNQGITNTGAIKIATSGSTQLSVRNFSAMSHYVIDVQGYFLATELAAVPPGSVYVPITPCRIVDTRVKGGSFKNGNQRNYRVTGTGGTFANQGGKANGCGIPVGATAIEGSVTAVAPEANGFFRAWPATEAMPAATFLNYTKNKGITNTGAIKIATAGTTQLTVRNYSATTHYVIDVQGYYLA